MDVYAQDFEQLFEQSSGCRTGMDEDSRNMRPVCPGIVPEVAGENTSIGRDLCGCSASGMRQ